MKQPDNPRELFRRKTPRPLFYLSRIPWVEVGHILIGSLIIALSLWLLSTRGLDRFDHVVLDGFFRVRPSIAAHPNIQMVEISEESIQKSDPWPWPRSRLAEMIDLLSRSGARAIVILFPLREPQGAEEDTRLAEAFKANGRVYLPIGSLDILEDSARTVGHLRLVPDPDGIVRRVQPFLPAVEQTPPYLPIRLASDLLGKHGADLDQLALPLDSSGRLLVNWYAPWTQTMARIDAAELSRIDPISFHGKICLVGLTGTGFADWRVTPLETAVPVAAIHAQVLTQVLDGQFIYPASFSLTRWFLIGMGLLSLVMFMSFGNVLSVAGGLLLALIWIGVSYLHFWKNGIWLSVIYPLFEISVMFVVSVLYSLNVQGKRHRLLSWVAARDSLTGLFTMRSLREKVNRLSTEAFEKKQPMSVVIINIDGLKEINDQHGHQAGDKVLQEIARIVQNELWANGQKANPNQPVVGRYGGEDILAVLPNTQPIPTGFETAEKLRFAVEHAPWSFDGRDEKVTISLGVSGLRRDENIPDLTIRRADQALHRAKERGRNQVCLDE